MNEEIFNIMRPYLLEGSNIEQWEVDYRKARSGWISPEGVFYPCSRWEHGDLINLLTDGQIQYMNSLNTKWIHVYMPLSETLINYSCEDAQLYPLLKLAEATGCLADYKKFIKTRECLRSA